MADPSRTTRSFRVLASTLLLALALGTAACSEDDAAINAGAPEQSAPTPDASVTAPTGAGRYPRYVALGDSYTAAPLVPDTDVTNGCLRSTNNYPALVADGLPGTELVDVSCSGADSSSMIGVQQTGNQPQPPQFDALTDDTDLVTVGIGGNDFNLFATLVGTCVRLRSSDPHGAPCREQFSSGGTDQLSGALRQIRGHVAAVVAGIRDRAPKASIVVVGYPQNVPEHGPCRSLLPLAAGDYAFGRRINEGLADAVEQGARKADAYVDTFGPSAGHDICSDDPWINGRITDPNRALAFHPFAAEQEAVAQLVLDEL